MNFLAQTQNVDIHRNFERLTLIRLIPDDQAKRLRDVLPLTRTCVGLTTIASAMFGSASDTRLMRAGEEMTIERPTSK